MIGHALRSVAWITEALIAAAWAVRTTELVRRLPTLPDLSGLDWDVAPKQEASLAVVVPARNEAANIGATMEALLLADYGNLLIVAVDDRSTDATGTILDEYAGRHPERMKVIHIEEQADGWLGKTFAMQLAMEQTAVDYLLFTDADVLFSPSILRRSVAFAVAKSADHVVVLPTMVVRGKGEGIVLGFFQVLGMWATRPWRVSDPKYRRDVLGVGAFNMVRRESLLRLGGLEPQRLAVLEDITLGRRMKAAGMKQAVAVAPGLVLVHWAKGASGLVGVMTKNLFSSVNFNPLLMLGACAWIMVFCVLPIVGLAWWQTMISAATVLFCVAATYRAIGASSGIDARYGWAYPLGALIFVWAMLRSMFFAFLNNGVVWRGTKYPLAELRRHNQPWRWEMEAKKLRRLEKLRGEG